MAICQLCQKKEADKKNTHYLTDAIIRTCLNVDGSNEREKGLYFALNNGSPFIDFNFQRLDEITLEKAMGRKPTEEEIENAKSIPFSVDHIFCRECEQLFSEIETKFIDTILPKFRKADLTGVTTLNEDDTKNVRNFFYIQVYRSAICEDILNLSSALSEKLRTNILEKNGENSIPLSVTYLQTIGEDNYTSNYVGFTNDSNPYITFMNDFIIQIYEDKGSVKFLPFHGLNEADFVDYININEDAFVFRVLSDEQRKTFLNEVIQHETVKQTLEQYGNNFNLVWRKFFRTDAPEWQKQHYIKSLIGGDQNNLLKYTKEEVIEFTLKYLATLFNVKE